MRPPGFINPERSSDNGPSLPISAIHPHFSTYHKQPFQSHEPLHFHGHHTRYTGVSEAPPRDTGGMNSHEFRFCQGITCKQTISEAVSIKAARARRQPHVCFDGRAVAGAGASSTGRRCNHPGGTPLQSLNWRAAGGQHTCV